MIADAPPTPVASQPMWHVLTYFRDSEGAKMGWDVTCAKTPQDAKEAAILLIPKTAVVNRQIVDPLYHITSLRPCYTVVLHPSGRTK